MPQDALLDYRDPRRDTPPPSRAVALLLCSPGAACWGVYLIDAFADANLPQPIGDFFHTIFWPLFFAAVVSAILSLIVYGRHPLRPQPWYVMLNLAINVSGLLFGAVSIVSLL